MDPLALDYRGEAKGGILAAGPFSSRGLAELTGLWCIDAEKIDLPAGDLNRISVDNVGFANNRSRRERVHALASAAPQGADGFGFGRECFACQRSPVTVISARFAIVMASLAIKSAAMS